MHLRGVLLTGVVLGLVLCVSSPAWARREGLGLATGVDRCPTEKELRQALETHLGPGTLRPTGSSGLELRLHRSGTGLLSLSLVNPDRVLFQRDLRALPEDCPDMAQSIALLTVFWLGSAPWTKPHAANVEQKMEPAPEPPRSFHLSAMALMGGTFGPPVPTWVGALRVDAGLLSRIGVGVEWASSGVMSKHVAPGRIDAVSQSLQGFVRLSFRNALNAGLDARVGAGVDRIEASASGFALNERIAVWRPSGTLGLEWHQPVFSNAFVKLGIHAAFRTRNEVFRVDGIEPSSVFPFWRVVAGAGAGWQFF